MKKMYSPVQVGFGSLFGGPLATVYFLKSNFDSRGNLRRSRQTLWLGGLFSVFFLAIIPFVSGNIPLAVMPACYVIPAILVVKNHQLSKHQIQCSDKYEFYPTQKVWVMSVFWAMVFLLAMLWYLSFARV